MFGPALPFALAARDDYEVVTVVPSELADSARALSSALALALHAFAPDLVIVDLFWAPLAYILPSLAAEAWLLVRSVPPVWFRGPRGVAFDRSLYARIIGIEPVGFDEVREHIEPIVICQPDERRPKGALRERLGVAPARRLAILMYAGLSHDRETLVPPEEVAVHSLLEDVTIFPLAPWLGDADAIYCGAGYNTYWEARWLGHEEKATMTPLVRQIDDQAWRVKACRSHRMRANGADQLAQAITGLRASLTPSSSAT
jgi:hypothetical protein